MLPPSTSEFGSFIFGFPCPDCLLESYVPLFCNQLQYHTHPIYSLHQKEYKSRNLDKKFPILHLFSWFEIYVHLSWIPIVTVLHMVLKWSYLKAQISWPITNPQYKSAFSLWAHLYMFEHSPRSDPPDSCPKAYGIWRVILSENQNDVFICGHLPILLSFLLLLYFHATKKTHLLSCLARQVCLLVPSSTQIWSARNFHTLSLWINFNGVLWPSIITSLYYTD